MLCRLRRCLVLCDGGPLCHATVVRSDCHFLRTFSFVRSFVRSSVPLLVLFSPAIPLFEEPTTNSNSNRRSPLVSTAMVVSTNIIFQSRILFFFQSRILFSVSVSSRSELQLRDQ